MISNKLKGISLVIPAHNSSAVIKRSIQKYSKFLSGISARYELIIVCNACSDDTEQISRAEAKKNKHARILAISERGKGFAVLAGFKAAKYPVIGFMDADCVFNLNSVRNMMKYLEEYDCVIASKWQGRSIFSIPEPLTRKILAVGWKALGIFFFHIRFHDTQAGCKFLSRKAFNSIDKNFICTGFDFDVELLYKLKKQGMKIKEVYVPLAKIYPFSTFRLKFVPGMFWRMLKLWAHNL
ncbi:MAG: glycosyltransferase [archaeon]